MVLLLLMASLFTLYAQPDIARKQGVYEYVFKSVDMGYDEALNALQQVTHRSSIRLVAVHPVTAPEGCAYRSTVLVLFDSAYAAELLRINSETAPFAVIDRVNLFEDEAGIHASIVNPVSVLRTVLMDDEKYVSLANEHRLKLRNFLIAALRGEKSSQQYGQFRKKGYIGRTMGVMAGGPFDQKIQTVLRLPDTDFDMALEKLKKSTEQPSEKWGLRLVYSVVLPGRNVAVLGISGPAMESKSFKIVKAGSDKSRKKFKCPGIAHAGAYPIEVVLHRNREGVVVDVVDAMYRMKMFFEDAGKWAFAKNMGMPGSIGGEIEAQIKGAFHKK